MIDQADQEIVQWASQVLATVAGPAAVVSLAAPDDAATGRGASLYLLDLESGPPSGNTRRLPLQVWLRYLVTTFADRPENAHQLLAALVFAAMESAELEVELEPLPVVAWSAFRATPRPSFFLRVPVRLERPEPETKRVLKPLVVRAVQLAALHGQVVTADDVPLAGATVELPALHLEARTDARGRFHFAAVPQELPPKEVRVTFKGWEQRFTVARDGSELEPLLIRFDLKEG